MKLYGQYILNMLKSQLQYKASFYLTVAVQFVQPFAGLAAIYFMFERFHSVDGWSKYQVFMCYAVISACFALASCFARGLDNFDTLIKSGEFDRILVRPRGPMLQVLGSRFDIKRIGQLIQALCVLAFAVYKINIVWDIGKVLLVVNMIIGGSLIFTGVYMLQATMCFWTVEGLEIASILTNGVLQYASYPLSIFPKGIRNFLTFIVPFGTVNYLPLGYLLGKTNGNALFFIVLPLIGGLFIVPCGLFWKFGVSRYHSTGS